jgi:hypothetical protein
METIELERVDNDYDIVQSNEEFANNRREDKQVCMYDLIFRYAHVAVEFNR